MKKGHNTTGKGLDRKLLYAVILATLALVALLTVYYMFLLPREKEWTAAIVDQLTVVPDLFDPAFNSTCSQLLAVSGFDVRYYAGEDVNIDFYRELPSKGDRILIVRAHSSIRGNTLNVDLYTSEVYQESLALGRYYDLAANKHISRAYFNYSDTEYFAVGPSFVSSVMEGELSESFVILMGCESLNQTSMAEALVSRGAKAVVGWTGDVTVSDTDTGVLELLELLLDRSYTLQGAVDKVNQDHPLVGTRLVYYPEAERDYIVPNREVEASLTLSKIMPAYLTISSAAALRPVESLLLTRRKRLYLLI